MNQLVTGSCARWIFLVLISGLRSTESPTLCPRRCASVVVPLGLGHNFAQSLFAEHSVCVVVCVAVTMRFLAQREVLLVGLLSVCDLS